MILGIGLDVVEIERIAKIIERTNKFSMRILSERERIKYESLLAEKRVEYLAGRFAAKEAYSKAVGTGIGAGCEFHQIEILNDEKGKPVLYFDEQLVAGFVSITHTKTVAAAQVILVAQS
jgi:holo-[acyl-carrier protein] synthase